MGLVYNITFCHLISVSLVTPAAPSSLQRGGDPLSLLGVGFI